MEYETDKLTRVQARVIQELQSELPAISQSLSVSEIWINRPSNPKYDILSIHIGTPLPNGDKTVSSECVIFFNYWLAEQDEEVIAAKLKEEFIALYHGTQQKTEDYSLNALALLQGIHDAPPE